MNAGTLPPYEIDRLYQALPQIAHIEYRQTLTSTNDCVFSTLDENIYQLMIAEEQTAGRGQRDHTWYSPMGLNCYFSLGCIETKACLDWPLFSPIVAGLVCAQVLELYLKEPIQLKWPNDVFIRGRKIAGILIENQWQGAQAQGRRCSVLGVGINVAMSLSDQNSLDQPDIDQPWIDMSQVIGEDQSIDRTALLIDFFSQLFEAISVYKANKLLPFINEWNHRHLYHQQLVRYNLNNQFEVTGIVQGIDEKGAILIQNEENAQAFSSGSITSIKPAKLSSLT